MAIKSMYGVSISSPYNNGIVIAVSTEGWFFRAKSIKETLEVCSNILKCKYDDVDVHKIGSDAVHNISSLDDLKELKNRLRDD